MFEPLPQKPLDFLRWEWAQIDPHYQALTIYELNASNVATRWLADWSQLAGLIYETYQRLYVGITSNTTDAVAEQRYNHFLDTIYTPAQAADQLLKQKLIQSGLQVPNFNIQLRNLKTESEIFSSTNVPLLAQELKLVTEYDRIIGDQTIRWNGSELTVPQTRPLLQSTDRATCERACWRLGMDRLQADYKPISDLWKRMLGIRRQLANNAGYDNYRDYRWKQLLRFDYTPEDSLNFHNAIEQAVVPAARQLYLQLAERLGLASLRPWDLDADPCGRPALKPFSEANRLEEGVAAIFDRVDPALGGYFAIMRREGLLDLENRKGKAPGGYCTEFPISNRPFILMNAVGIHEDVQTLLHEGGHAFHVFESAHLPFLKQKEYPTEFAEVASMSMELLGAKYLSMPGGFYTPVDAARARVSFLTESIWFWPYMATVDAFQHWAYSDPNADDPASCDAAWSDVWDRFMPGIDWSGLEDIKASGWQRKAHIFEAPFYYIEYGLALLGAFQVWRNSLDDLKGAIAAYRHALSLGATATLPELFQAAGARLAFDADTLRQTVDLAVGVINELEHNSDG